MAIVPYTANPKITDQILFDLYMPMGNGCFTQDPVSIDTIKIFFISRSLTNIKDYITNEKANTPLLQRAYYVATEEYCVAQTDIEKQTYEARQHYIKSLLDASQYVPAKLGSLTYYSEAVLVYCQGETCAVGNPPLWVADENNTDSIIQKVDDPELPNGHFRFIWEPGPIKEGDYYICYSYTMRTSPYNEEVLTKYENFYIATNIQNEVAVPTHACPPGKYFELLNAYLPEMYKTNHAKQDFSVFTLEALNKSLASVFTELDNQGSRLIDILDANVTLEPYLGQLAALFGLQLRSTDITRWRGQIITAVPLFKRKGTLGALAQAFEQAGMYLSDFYQFWQITLPQVYTETFTFDGSYEFVLTEYTDNDLFSTYPTIFDLELAVVGTTEFVSKQATQNLLLSFSQNSKGKTVCTWNSGIQNLTKGDIIKLTYVTQNMSSAEVALYEYWRDILPLQDVRPFFLILPNMPPKNWNVRVITSSDPLFRTFIPVLNPYADPVVFGQIRTDFPYSENVYNMDEYNGSLRDSLVPGDIAPEFLEPCTGGISAYYGINLVIQDLSNFRLTEVAGILQDYTPFHSILHSISYTGYLIDYVKPPVENIEWLMQYNVNDYCIAGDAQYAFKRTGLLHDFTSSYSQANGLLTVLRDMLATMESTPAQTGTLTLYNKYLVIQPNLKTKNFKSLNINTSSCLLEILDGFLAGTKYSNPIQTVQDFSLVINSATATSVGSITPLLPFTFRLSNLLHNGSFDVIDASQFMLSTVEENIEAYNIKTVQEDGSSNAWTVNFNSNVYKVLYVNNNQIYLQNNTVNPLPTTSATGQTFTLVNTQTSNNVFTVTDGTYEVCTISKFTSTSVFPFTTTNMCVAVADPILQITDDGGVTYYQIYSIDPQDSNSFLVLNYQSAVTTTSLPSVDVYNWLLTTNGSFNFTGMVAVNAWTTFTNSQTLFGSERLPAYIYPENTLLEIDIGGTDYTYTMQVEFAGNDQVTPSSVDILGYYVSVGTIDTNPAGVSYGYNLYKYDIVEYSPVIPEITGQFLYYVNRAGQTVWNSVTNSTTGFFMNAAEKSQDKQSGTGQQEFVRTTESLKFVVETLTGEKIEGEIK